MLRTRTHWLLNFALWTGVALVQSFQSYTGALSEGLNPQFGSVLGLQLATWYPWAFLAPVLFDISRRYPLDRLFSYRTLLVFPLIGLACVSVQIFAHTVGMVLFPSSPDRLAAFGSLYLQMLRWMAFPQLIVFASIIGASHAINYYQKFRERELSLTHLEQQLTEARLLTLQMQLQPHFFFNTLHSIASLVRDRQNDAAVSMIAQLSELLRYTLDQVNKQKVSLGHELEFIHRYLEIEQTRFSDRLKVEMRIEPEALSALVPSLLLQPLVENAVKHGISRLSQPGELVIEALRTDHKLFITITNDGIGLFDRGSSKRGEGLGLRNARQRLQQLYGERHQFQLSDHGNGKVAVSLTIPFEESTRQTS